jgi:hypothetical protein
MSDVLIRVRAVGEPVFVAGMTIGREPRLVTRTTAIISHIFLKNIEIVDEVGTKIGHSGKKTRAKQGVTNDI